MMFGGGTWQKAAILIWIWYGQKIFAKTNFWYCMALLKVSNNCNAATGK